jgi:hypothetical protein
LIGGGVIEDLLLVIVIIEVLDAFKTNIFLLYHCATYISLDVRLKEELVQLSP